MSANFSAYWKYFAIARQQTSAMLSVIQRILYDATLRGTSAIYHAPEFRDAIYHTPQCRDDNYIASHRRRS